MKDKLIRAVEVERLRDKYRERARNPEEYAGAYYSVFASDLAALIADSAEAPEGMEECAACHGMGRYPKGTASNAIDRLKNFLAEPEAKPEPGLREELGNILGALAPTYRSEVIDEIMVAIARPAEEGLRVAERRAWKEGVIAHRRGLRLSDSELTTEAKRRYPDAALARRKPQEKQS